MSLNRHDLSLPQGDSLQRQFEFTDPTGAPIDLTGFTVTLQMRQTPLSPSALAVLDTDTNGGLTFVNDDPTTGKVIVDLLPAVSAQLPVGTFSWALKIAQLPSFSWTPVWGFLTVHPETAK